MFENLARRLRYDSVGLKETFARFQAGFLALEDLHGISKILNDLQDFHGLLAGWPAARLASSLCTELPGLLGLLGLQEGLFGFLASLEGGMNHVVPHARHSERTADFSEEFQFCKVEK